MSSLQIKQKLQSIKKIFEQTSNVKKKRIKEFNTWKKNRINNENSKWGQAKYVSGCSCSSTSVC